MTTSGTEKSSLRVTLIRSLITIIVLALLLSFPRTPPHTSVEKWTSGFPLHPFKWSTYAQNLWDLWHRISTLNPGLTLDGQSIWKLTTVDLGSSVTLLSLSVAVAFIFGMWKGIYDGIRTPKPTTGSGMSGFIQWLIESIPEFFLIFALELFGFFLNRQGVKVYFIGSTAFWSGTLVPAVLLSLFPMMYLARVVKISVADQLGQLYLVTARSKGLKPFSILRKHIFPNCLRAASDNLAPMLGILFSGLVIVEYLFNRKGIGSGLFFAMGHDGISPIYGVPGGQPPVASGHPFDVNLCVAYMVAAALVFAGCWIVLRVILRLMGDRGVANSYGSLIQETEGGRRISPQLMIGALMFLLLLFLSLFARHLPLPAPNHGDVIHMQGTSMTTPPFPPSWQHLFGTDSAGRDLFSRCVYGIGPTFLYVALADVIVMLIASVFAILSSVVEWKTIRFCIDTWNAVTSVIPGVILALLLLEIPTIYWAGLHAGPGRIEWGHIHQILFMAVLAVIEGGRVARQFQLAMDTEHQHTYMEAATISGNTRWTRLLLYDLRPLRDTLIEQVIVTFTRLLLLTATLGFFQDLFKPTWLLVNFGTWTFSGDSLDWGSLFAQNSRDFLVAPWVMFPVSTFVAWTAISLNLVQIGLRRFTLSRGFRTVRKPSLAFRMTARTVRRRTEQPIPGERENARKVVL